MAWMALYVLTGALVGFLGGLLGIGGGMMLVPILAALFTAQALTPDHTVHLALATAMASAVVTAGASAREHHRHGAVDWRVVKRMAPGMMTGSLLATLASGTISQRTLAIAFALIVYAAATQMLFGKKSHTTRDLPAPVPMFFIGIFIGIVSGLVSAGGTFLVVPVMLYCGIAMHTAIGTGAAIGISVTLVGTLGYILGGWHVSDLPEYHLGFVFLPAFIALVAGSVITAPFGARMTHRLPVVALKRIFAFLMYLLATKMLVTYY